MIKILVVVNSLEVNGVTNVAMSYYRNVNKNKFKMDFVTGENNDIYYKNEILNNKDTIYFLPSRNKSLLKYAIAFSKVLRKNKYDIIHIHGNSSTIGIETMIAKFMGVKVRIAHAHSSSSVHKTLNQILHPLLIKSYTCGIACSNEAGKWMFGNQQFKVLENGIDLKDFKFNNGIRKNVRQKLGLTNEFVMGHIGHFIDSKNHKFLLEIFNDVVKIKSNARLLLVGKGPLEEEIRKKAVELGVFDKVIFYGVTKNANEMLQAMDAFVFPSIVEGFGIVLIEAQAAGLPCLVSSTVPKEVKATSSLEFEKLEEPSNNWAKQITGFNQDRSKWSGRLDQFDIKEVVNKLECIYQENASSVN